MLYRLRLSNAGLRLQKKRAKEAEHHLEIGMEACRQDRDEAQWVLGEARTAPNERRQRFLDLVTTNASGPLSWTGIWDWPADENPYAM